MLHPARRKVIFWIMDDKVEPRLISSALFKAQYNSLPRTRLPAVIGPKWNMGSNPFLSKKLMKQPFLRLWTTKANHR